jgi:hypothetical protein
VDAGQLTSQCRNRCRRSGGVRGRTPRPVSARPAARAPRAYASLTRCDQCPATWDLSRVTGSGARPRAVGPPRAPGYFFPPDPPPPPPTASSTVAAARTATYS